jgi:hypothetical protein
MEQPANAMRTTADLVAFLRQLMGEKKLSVDGDDLGAFAATKMNRDNVQGRSVEQVRDDLIASKVPGGPARLIADALCEAINGAVIAVGEPNKKRIKTSNAVVVAGQFAPGPVRKPSQASESKLIGKLREGSPAIHKVAFDSFCVFE